MKAKARTPRDEPRSLDDRPGLLKGRSTPDSLPVRDKLAFLHAVEDLLGKAWLSKGPAETHPLRALWSRHDWLATAELLSFGHAIHAIKPVAPEPWLRDHRRRFQTMDLNSARGSAFEIALASMLYGSGQKVEFAPPSQPGYDLSLLLPNGRRLRISCKALSASNYEERFHAFSVGLFDQLRRGMPPGVPRHVVLQAKQHAELPTKAAVVKAAVGHVLAGAGPNGASKLGTWNLVSFPLRPVHHATFSGEHVSVGLNVVAPHGAHEQKRFEDKLDEACSNLAEHCPSVGDREGNAIALRVPEAISLDAAMEYASDGRLLKHPSISAAFLFRTQVCGNGYDLGLGHEAKVVRNPAAAWPLNHYAPSGTLTLHMLMGQILGARPVDAPHDPPFRAPAAHHHAYERQHHHYIRSEYTLDRPPPRMGLSTQWTIYGSQRIDLQFMHGIRDRALVLL